MEQLLKFRSSRAFVLLAFALGCLAAGGAARTFAPTWAHGLWLVGLMAASAPMLLTAARSLLRGDVNVDLIASLAMLAAMGTDNPVPGLIIVVMQNGGEMLEAIARGRATDTVRALEQDVPRLAHRLRMAGQTLAEEVDVAAVRAGDVLLLKPGETVPCDAIVIDGRSQVNTARITGEPLPRTVEKGAQLWSGMQNLGGSLTLRATATASESQYAKLVELVRFGQASKAPLQRMADRAAGWFTPLTVLACVVTYIVTRDASRVLAVLVVATPCPLLLATPVAIIGGVDRAAGQRIIFRTGEALERLSSITAAVFDKTGTITVGEPRVECVRSVSDYSSDEILSLAAAVEGHSSHTLAQSVIHEATSRGLAIHSAQSIDEHAGEGVLGTVGAHVVGVGSRTFVAARTRITPMAADDGSELSAQVLVDGAHAGEIRFADQLRPEMHDVFRRLATLGVRRITLLSGDSVPHTERMAARAGITDAHGDLLPPEKVAFIEQLIARGERVMMVGDGVNDAPALVAATVGVAIAAKQGGLAANSADVVLLRDDLRGIPAAITISRHTVRIARQCIGIGLGLSVAAMGFAAFGLLPALPGALLQEAIDVAVILNALRTRGAGSSARDFPLATGRLMNVSSRNKRHDDAGQATTSPEASG